jgi:hypothetical protein
MSIDLEYSKKFVDNLCNHNLDVYSCFANGMDIVFDAMIYVMKHQSVGCHLVVSCMFRKLKMTFAVVAKSSPGA